MVEVRTTSPTGGQKGVKPEAYHLIPVEPLRLLAIHYGVGAQKYAPHQWRKGIESSKLYSAAQRHLNQDWNREDYDVCPINKDNEDGYGGEDCIENHPETGAVATRYLDVGRTCYNHTGSLHLINAIWMLMALVELRITHPELDDRYSPEVRRLIDKTSETGSDVNPPMPGFRFPGTVTRNNAQNT